jgi:glycosyltransferase involved in cell wall biosynthesis
VSRRAPEVSVVVPLYNKASYILRCLESIRRQSFDNFEVIVVDDGSTDGSGSLAAELRDARFTLLRQENRGSGAARNRGIRESRAELIAFLDADDAWEPGFLETIAELAKCYPEAGLFATGYRRHLDTGFDKVVTLRPELGRISLITDYLPVARQGDLVTSSSVAVRRSLLVRAGGFIEGQPLGEDQELWARLSLYSPVAFDRRILSTYHSEAADRICRVLEMPTEPYPAVQSLRRMLQDGSLGADRRREVEYHVDWLLFSQICAMLYDCSRRQVRARIRQEKLGIFRFRVWVGLLETALLLVPPRWFAAARLKPANWLRAARRLDPLDKVASMVERMIGNVVMIRFVPTSSSRETQATAPMGIGQ